MKTLAFCRILWYNVYMENREMQTSNTEEMVTISAVLLVCIFLFSM